MSFLKKVTSFIRNCTVCLVSFLEPLQVYSPTLSKKKKAMKQRSAIACMSEAPCSALNPPTAPPRLPRLGPGSILLTGGSLTRDEDGKLPQGSFSYSSVVGMLLYLSGHTRPDIAYAVNCCACYMFNPCLSHEKGLKQIGRYCLSGC